MKYSAVIAAAGLSSRMHEFKPMLCLDGNTMIEHVIRSFREAGVEEIVVVGGYKAELLEKHLKPCHVTFCNNTEFAVTKMFDSLCMGLRALKEPCDGIFLTPGDVPLVKPETIRAMQEIEAEAVRPVYEGGCGHPVLINSSVIERFLAHSGQDGMRGALEGFRTVDVPVDDSGILLDADTPEDFKLLHRKAMEDRSGGRLWPEIDIRISKGDVVLDPEKAQLVEMIGHTGSIQTACACMHMSYSKGWKLLNRMEEELGYPLLERSTGGASGGGSTISEKGRRLLDAYSLYRIRMKEAAETLFAEIFTTDMDQ